MALASLAGPVDGGGLLSRQRRRSDREDQRENSRTHCQVAGVGERSRRAPGARPPPVTSDQEAGNPDGCGHPPVRSASTAALPNVLAIAPPAESNRAARTRCPARSKKNRKASSRTAIQTAPMDTTRAKTDAASQPDEPGGSGRGKPAPGRVERRNVPGLEDLDLRHHPVAEQRGWREMWQRSSALTTCRASASSARHFGATLDVRHERSDAESGLAVEELIDFVW